MQSENNFIFSSSLLLQMLFMQLVLLYLEEILGKSHSLASSLYPINHSSVNLSHKEIISF